MTISLGPYWNSLKFYIKLWTLLQKILTVLRTLSSFWFQRLRRQSKTMEIIDTMTMIGKLFDL